MNDKPKDQLEQVEGRLQGLEKRFEDMKWYFGGATTLLALAMSIFSVVSSWNVSNERSSLLQFENNLRADVGKQEDNLRADIGKVEVPPELTMLVLGGGPLEGTNMEATVEPRDSGQIVLRIVIVLRNVGGSRSGPMSVAGYSMDPIQLANLSADEPRFKYEAYIPENRFPIDEVPVGFASQFEVAFALKAKIPGGSYPFLMKIFYGSTGNKMVKAQFNVLIKE